MNDVLIQSNAHLAKMERFALYEELLLYFATLVVMSFTIWSATTPAGYGASALCTLAMVALSCVAKLGNDHRIASYERQIMRLRVGTHPMQHFYARSIDEIFPLANER